jgi:hypothetical protein
MNATLREDWIEHDFPDGTGQDSQLPLSTLKIFLLSSEITVGKGECLLNEMEPV